MSRDVEGRRNKQIRTIDKIAMEAEMVLGQAIKTAAQRTSLITRGSLRRAQNSFLTGCTSLTLSSKINQPPGC